MHLTYQDGRFTSMTRHTIAVYLLLCACLVCQPVAYSKNQASHSKRVALPKASPFFEECLKVNSPSKAGGLSSSSVEDIIVDNLPDELTKITPYLRAHKSDADYLWLSLVKESLGDPPTESLDYFVGRARSLWYLSQAAIVADQFPKPDLRVASCLHAIASLCIEDPRFARRLSGVEPMLQKAIEICRQTDNPIYLANCNATLGQFYYQQAKFDSALNALTRALDLYRTIDGAKQNAASVQLLIGCCYMRQYRFDLAVQFFKKSYRFYESLDGDCAFKECSLHAAAVSSALANEPDAEKLLEASMKQNEPEHSKAMDLFCLALLKCKQEKFEEASSLLQQASSFAGTQLWGIGNSTIGPPRHATVSNKELVQLYVKALLQPYEIHNYFCVQDSIDYNSNKPAADIQRLAKIAEAKSQYITIRTCEPAAELSSQLKLISSEVARYYKPKSTHSNDRNSDQGTTVNMSIDKDGHIQEIKIAESSKIANNDCLALKALISAVPFRNLAFNGSYPLQLDAKFHPEVVISEPLNGSSNRQTKPTKVTTINSHHVFRIRKNVTITVHPDFDVYMQALSAKIHNCWFPPPAGNSWTAILTFEINSDGETSKIQVSKSSGSDWLDDACIQAVKWAAPFEPLPLGAKESAPIEFTFTYNQP